MQPYTRWRVSVFASTWITYAGYYLCRKNLSVAKAPLAADFHFSNTELGWIETAFLGAYAVGQFINGPMGDRFGPRVIIVIGLIVSALVNVAFGFGASLGVFLITYGINGYAQSTGWPGMVKTFANWFSRSERGTLMGLWSTCYQLGSAGATAFATLMLVNFGWRWAFFAPAALMGAVVLIYVLFSRTSPEDVGLPSIEVYKNEPGATPIVSAASSTEPEEPLPSVLREVFTNPSVWITGITYFFLKLVRYALLFWLPLFLVQHLKYDNASAGYASVAFEIAGFLGSIFAGFVSDRFFQARRAPITAIMLVGLAVSCYVFSLVTHTAAPGTLVVHMLGMGLLGFMIYGPDTILSGTGAIDFGSKRGASTAAGIINGLGSIGTVIQGILVGWVTDTYGWEYLFNSFIIFALIAAALMATRWNVRSHS